MQMAQIPKQIRRTQRQQIQLQGINLSDNYTDGQMESCYGIEADRYPYINTANKLAITDTGITPPYQPISMFAWEKLFVVSDEPSENGGYKCYYGGNYCGDAVNTDLPKQYAVVNSKLVLWPDQVYFNLYDNELQSHPLTTAPLYARITSGDIIYRKAVTS